LFEFIFEFMSNPRISEYCKPEHRFPNHRQDHTQKHPNGYLTPLLKRLLSKKIKYEDPETQKIIKGLVKDAIVWRYILNACQGETQAIEGIFDRLDGKINQNGKGGVSAIILNIRNQSGLLTPGQAELISSKRSEV
jgi:hypothetical protein